MAAKSARALVVSALSCQRSADLQAILASAPRHMFASSTVMSACVLQMAKLRKQERFQGPQPDAKLISTVLMLPSSSSVSTESVDAAYPTLSAKTLSKLCYGIASGRLATALPQELFGQLNEAAVAELAPQHLANCVWSFASLRQPCPPALLESIKRCSMDKMDQFNLQDIATLVWSLATLSKDEPPPLQQQQHEDLFRRCESVLLRQQLGVSSVSPQAVSNIAWAFATHRVLAPQLFDRLAVHCSEPSFAAQASSQAVVNVLWSFATAHHHCGGEAAGAVVVDAMVECLRGELEGRDALSPLDVSNAMWSLATLRRSSPFSAQWLERHLHAQSIPLFSTSMLSRVMWSVASSSSSSTAIADETKALIPITGMICDHLAKVVVEASWLDVSMICWALATLKQQWPHCFELPSREYFAAEEHTGALKSGAELLFERLSQRTMTAPPNANAAAVRNTMWAFAAMGLAFPREWLLLDVVRWESGLAPRQLATVLQSYAMVHATSPPPPRLDELCRHLERVWRSYPPRDLGSVLWSLACMDLLREECVRALFVAVFGEESASSRGEQDKSPQDQQQMFQAKLAWSLTCCQASAAGGGGGAVLLPPPLRTTSSKVQLYILHELRQRFPSDESVLHEYVLPGCSLGVDIYLPRRQCAVEVNGPSHFMADGQTYLGSSAFKHRMLGLAGTRCVHVHVQDFVNASAEERKAILDRLYFDICGSE